MESELLDVVIGVVFVWFLLSLLLSAVNEGLALATHVRAKHLWLGIGRLLDPKKSPLPRRLWSIGVTLPLLGRYDLRPKAPKPDEPVAIPNTGDAKAKAAALTANWLDKKKSENITTERAVVRVEVQQLHNVLADHVADVAKPNRRSKLSYVDAAAFADALLDRAHDALEGSVFAGDLIEIASNRPGWNAAQRAALRTALAGNTDPISADDLVALPQPALPGAQALRNLHAEAAKRFTGRDVAHLLRGNTKLAEAVRKAAATAGVDQRVDAVKKVIGGWFDREMSDLSRYYRRQSRKILLLLSVPLVLLTHANTIEIFSNLRNDSALRTAMVSAAGESVAAGFEAAGCTPASTTTTAPVTPTTVSFDDVREQFQCVGGLLESAEEFRIGLAWQEIKETRGLTGAKASLDKADVFPYLGNALGDDWGFVGRTITLIALAFGAQFWFDVLKRLVGMRKPATTQPTT